MGNFFLQIADMSITASYLIVAVVILRFLLAKAPKWIRGILWGLVGIRLVVPFSFESAFSLMPGSSPISAVNKLQGSGVYNAGNMMPMWDFSTSAGAAPQSTDVAGALVPVGSTGDALSALTNATEAVAGTVSFPDILAIVWLAGMSAMLVYCLVSYLRLNKKVADAVIYRGGKYAIYQSEKVTSPFVLGIFNPRIFLPYDMDGKDRDCVIAHEKAHIARRDHWMKPFGFVLLSVYWFHPFIWLAYILLCRDIELACDEKVIKEMGSDHKKAYSEALLKCSAPGRMISACPLAFGEVDVKKRIVNVLHYKKPAFWIILVSLLACVVVAVCFMTKPKEQEVPFINDGRVSWENVDEIILYSDGYYGCTLEEPLVITDAEDLKKILEATLDANAYREVEDGEQLEGLGVIFIDYQNGAVLSMYSEPNYGMISDTMQTTGATCYYVPKELHDTVIGLLKEEYDREILSQTGQLPNSGTKDIPFESITSTAILRKPPTLTMQDALSSAMNFTYVESGTYGWTYPTGNSNEMTTVNADGAFPTVAVKGKEDKWIQVTGYNGIDYAPYMLSWGVEPDRIRVKEYDLLDLGNMEPLVLDEYTLEDVYFLELRPRRIYEVIAEWDEGSNEFYGEATYVFATDNYAVSGTMTEEEQPVLIEATIKELMADETDKICITSETDAFTGAFVVQIPEGVYPIDSLKGGQQIVISMKDTGEMYDEHLPLYEALAIRVRPNASGEVNSQEMSGAGGGSENAAAMSGMNLPAVMDAPWTMEVNTLDGVTLSMEKYTDTNGDLEINNQLRLNLQSSNDLGKVLQTGAWFTIQREVDGAWYDLVPIAEVAWEQIAYNLPAGETTVLPTTWEYVYGALPTGEYRIVIKIHDWRAPGDFDEYYLADEFEIMKSY